MGVVGSEGKAGRKVSGCWMAGLGVYRVRAGGLRYCLTITSLNLNPKPAHDC